jgi:uncharacterized membrane protein YidH (DUF202 family)
MIRGYSDHAANERTFLAWVRTAITEIASGFVIEKFNLTWPVALNGVLPCLTYLICAYRGKRKLA